KPAARRQVRLTSGNLLPQRSGRRQPGDARERSGVDANPRQLRRFGVVTVEVPVDDVWLGEEVAEEAEARHLDGVAPGIPGVALDVEQLDLQQVAGCRAVNVDRAG